MEEKNSIPDKASLRRETLKRRELLSRQDRDRAELFLTERILGHQWYYLSEILLGYAPYGTEIDIFPILTDALKCGKRVYLPRVMGEEMEFFRIKSLTDLKPGYHGILEPDKTGEVFDESAAENKKTLMLMPGAAFDAERNRIGYGKGFYDRYLQRKEALQIFTVAVGFQCQMVRKIMAEEHDRRPDQIICV